MDTLSSVPILAQPASPPTEAQPPEPQLAEPQLAEAQLAEASPQAVDNRAEDAAAALQQPAEGGLLHWNGMSEVTGNGQGVQTGQTGAEEATHLNGSQQPNGDVQLDSNHQEPEAQVRANLSLVCHHRTCNCNPLMSKWTHAAEFVKDGPRKGCSTERLECTILHGT